MRERNTRMAQRIGETSRQRKATFPLQQDTDEDTVYPVCSILRGCVCDARRVASTTRLRLLCIE